MSKVKLGLSRLNAAALLLKANHLVTKMTGNANYPAPDPSLADIQNAISALATATDEAMNRDKAKVAIRRLREADMKNLLVKLGAYVQVASGGDADKIISSGFEVVQRGGPRGPLTAVLGLISQPGVDFGSVTDNWDRLPGARVYVVEKNTVDPMDEAMWKLEGYCTATHYTITGLTTGSVVWSRIRGIGVTGLGPPSDPARSIVP